MVAMKSFVYRHRYSMVILIILTIQFFSVYSLEINDYLNINYVIDYGTGFGPRKFVGSVLNMIVPGEEIRHSHALLFILVATVVFTLVVAYVAERFLKMAREWGDKVFLFSIFMVCMYIVSPTGPQYLYHADNLGRMDLYILMACFLFLSVSSANRYVFYAVSTLLMVMSCLIHQIFVCVFLPLYAAVYIYRIMSSENYVRELACAFVSMLCLVVVFASVQFAPAHNLTIGEMNAYLLSKTNMDIPYDSLYYEYYAPITAHLFEFVPPRMDRMIFGFITNIMLLSPLIGVFWWFWRSMARNASSERCRHMILLMNLTFLVAIPAFVTTVDYGRWFSALVTCQFMLVGLLLYKGVPSAVSAAGMMVEKAVTHRFCTIMFIAYLASLGCYMADALLPGTNNIFWMIKYQIG